MLICAASLNAQEQVTYTDVIDVDGKSKDELYCAAKIWFTTTYNSANNVIQMDNKENGVLIGKALFKYNYPKLNGSGRVAGTIDYIIKFYFKDNRYKYEITEFIHKPYDSNEYKTSFGLITTHTECDHVYSGIGFMNKTTKKWEIDVWNDIKRQIENNAIPLVVSLKNGMTKQVESISTDW